jgi:hypothetical protein
MPTGSIVRGRQPPPTIQPTAPTPATPAPYIPTSTIQVVQDISAYTTTYRGIPVPVTQDPEPADPAAMYPDFRILSYYWKDRRIYMGGVTSPGGFSGKSVVFFQLAAPTLLWICDWTCAKYSSQPMIPNIVPEDSNWVLMDEDYEAANVIVGPDKRTPMYRLSGYYIFGHQNPDTYTLNNIRFGRPPWINDSVPRLLSPGMYIHRLSDGNGGVAGTLANQLIAGVAPLAPAGLNTVGIPSPQGGGGGFVQRPPSS